MEGVKIYYPAYLKIPKDVYRKSIEVAGSYYVMLGRRLEFDGRQPQTLVNEWQIKAIEDAWQMAEDEVVREFIKKNLFEGVQMQYIPLAMSQSGMKRSRKKFLESLAENLGLF